MAKEKETEIEKMGKDFQRATGMRMVGTPQPPQGNTEFAKDKKQKK